MKRDSRPRSSIPNRRCIHNLWVYLLVVTIGVVMGTGCSKQRAGLSLNKAKKLLIEAEKREA